MVRVMGAGIARVARARTRGYTLTTLDPRVRRQVEEGEAFLDRYRDVFVSLAK